MQIFSEMFCKQNLTVLKSLKNKDTTERFYQQGCTCEYSKVAANRRLTKTVLKSQ